MRTLNFRLLGMLLLGTVLTSAAAYGLHEVQVRRHADVLLREADAAKQRGDSDEAIDLLDRYVTLVRTNNAGPLADLGLLQADAHRGGQAFRSLEMALRQDPNRVDVRRKLVDVAIGLRRFSDARDHVNTLLKRGDLQQDKAEQAELLRLLALCQAAAADYQAAADSLEQAIEKAPDKVEYYAERAYLLDTRLKKPDAAISVLNRMVDENPDSSQAYVLRGAYRLGHRNAPIARTSANKPLPGDEGTKVEGPESSPPDPQDAASTVEPETEARRLELALKDARQALKLAPDEEAVIAFAVRCLLASNERDEAQALVLRGIQLFPKNASLYGSLADLELRAGRRGEAIACLTRGLEANPQELDLRWTLAQMLIDEGNITEAEKALVQLRTMRYPEPPIEFLKSRILIEKGNWFDASQLLEAIRPSLVGWPGLVQQTDLRLGQCYERLGRSDLQLSASRRAASVDARSIPARLGVARALLSAGQVDEAAEEFQQISALPGAPPAVLGQLAQLQIMANLRRKPSDANWDVAGRLLDKLAVDDPASTAVPLLRAEILAARGEVQKAEDLLRAARDQSPDTEDYWLGLVSLADRQEDPTRATELLDQAQAAVGDTVAIRLGRARHLVNRQGPAVKEALRELAQPGAEFTKDQQLALAGGIAGLTLAIGDYDETERLYRRVADEQPTNLQVRRMLLELAFRTEKPEMMERELEAIGKIEHQGSLWHYGEALRLVVVAKKLRDEAPDDERSALAAQVAERYSKAKAHLAEARVARPRWWRIPTLLGQISDLQGDEDQALASYLEAIKLGETNSPIIMRAGTILYARKRDHEADKIIRDWQAAQMQLTTEMAQLATEVSLRLNDGERALSLVAQVDPDSKNAKDHVWAGRVLGSLGKSDEAERRFRKALELDETSSVAWLSLIQLLGRTSQTEKANAALAEAEQKLSPAEAPLVMAEALDVSGRLDEAEAKYKAALVADPAEIRLVRGLAEFYLRHSRPKEAESLLAQIIEVQPGKPEDRAWGRYNLAQVLMSRGTLDSLKKALALLEENLAAKPASEPDLRIKAVVLSRLPDRESQGQAIGILEKLVGDQQAPAGDAVAESRFLLAQLYLVRDEVAKATAQLRKLLATGGDDPDPRYLTFYVRFLLQRKELNDAELWVGRLVKQAPEDFNTIALATEVQFAREKYTNVLTDIDAFLSSLKGKDTDRQSAMARCAILLETYAARLKLAGAAAAGNDSAETLKFQTSYTERAASLYRDYSLERPDYPLALAGFLGRQGRHSESLDILEREWPAARPEDIVAVTSTLLRSPTATDDDYTRAEAVLTSAIDMHDRPLPLILAYADLQNWHERFDDAERLYREVLDKDPRNAATLNNLSLLLALRGQLGPEPQSMIEKALQVVGDNPSLLDTRATISLLKGDLPKAASDLARAIERSASPQKYFHLAQVEMRQGKRAAARETLEKAASLRLKTVDLHPLERDAYRKLQAELQ